MRDKGFTLLEMMLVVSICMCILLALVPIFRVVTSTVKSVERKLATYEAARNILDNISKELKLAVMNERGGLFGIKKYRTKDKDPFTPVLSDAKQRFTGSRREADGCYFTLLQAGGYRFNNKSLLPGSMCFPMAYPQYSMMYPEGWRGSIRSSYLTPVSGDFSGTLDPDRDAGYYEEQTNNVSLAELQVAYDSLSNVVGKWTEAPPSSAQHIHQWDPQFFDELAPGRELIRHYATMGTSIGNIKYRKASTVRCMDLEFAWWDDTVKAFKILNDFRFCEGIYFAPLPKAVRVTITVCDPLRRAKVTLSRIVRLPTGSGRGLVYRNNATLGDRDFLNKSDTDFTPAPFNRAKHLGVVEPIYGGYP